MPVGLAEGGWVGAGVLRVWNWMNHSLDWKPRETEPWEMACALGAGRSSKRMYSTLSMDSSCMKDYKLGGVVLNLNTEDIFLAEIEKDGSNIKQKRA